MERRRSNELLIRACAFVLTGLCAFGIIATFAPPAAVPQGQSQDPSRAHLAPYLISDAVRTYLKDEKKLKDLSEVARPEGQGTLEDRARSDMGQWIRAHVLSWNRRAGKKEGLKDFLGDKAMMVKAYEVAFKRRLAQLKAQGLDIDTEESLQGAMALARPVFDELYPSEQVNVQGAVRHSTSGSESPVGPNGESAVWQDKVREAMKHDNWTFLLAEMSKCLSTALQDASQLFHFLALCDSAALSQPLYPIESRYPILRAVALLSKEQQDALVGILTAPENYKVHNLIIVDSILLMLDAYEKMPGRSWLSAWAPNLKGRRVWQVASEIWYPGGGLGRVMQYHGIAMHELLKGNGAELCHVEPFYAFRRDKFGNHKPNGVDFYASLPSRIRSIHEVCRFPVTIGSVNTWAIVYCGCNKYGIATYLIGDTGKDGGENGTEAYYTKMMYNYSSQDNPVSWEEFSAFFSMASLELVRRVEAVEREKDPEAWKSPLVHTNDSQLALFDIYQDMQSKAHPDDEVLKRTIIVPFTTHTYPNRGGFSRSTGEWILGRVGVPGAYWEYFYKNWGEDVDFTSAAIRWAHEHGNWTGGVSAKHVDDIAMYDKWGRWESLQLVAVTNGDYRAFTAEQFRAILRELFPDADVEHPTPAQVLQTKKEAKKRLGLDPDRYVVSYSGRLVDEKVGRERAFTNANIEELVKMGVQVVIYGNVQDNDASRELERGLRELEDSLKGKGYPGKFLFVSRFDIDDQRMLLAATDIQVQDSHPRTEAAGYSEADVSSCGGFELAPPWIEGILQVQGVRINLGVPGEGNTLTPEDGKPESYLKILKDVLSKTPEELSVYQATSVRLSRVLEARLTSAEYLRQFSNSVARREGRGAGVRHPSSGSTVEDGDLHAKQQGRQLPSGAPTQGETRERQPPSGTPATDETGERQSSSGSSVKDGDLHAKQQGRQPPVETTLAGRPLRGQSPSGTPTEGETRERQPSSGSTMEDGDLHAKQQGRQPPSGTPTQGETRERQSTSGAQQSHGIDIEAEGSSRRWLALEDGSRIVNETYRVVEERLKAHASLVTRPISVFVHKDLMPGDGRRFREEKGAFSFDSGVTIRLFSSMDTLPANFNPDTDVLVTTQAELAQIAQGTLKVDPKVARAARMLGVEVDERGEHPFLREILVSAVLLGNMEERDIDEKSPTYESFRMILSLLRGREVSPEQIRGLIAKSDDDPGAISDRARRILKLLISKPMVRFDIDEITHERAVLWAA